MNRQKNRSLAPVELVTLVLVVGLIWSVGLVGGGLWQLVRYFGIQSAQTQQTTPDSFAKVQNVPAGLFNYGGSNAWAPIRLLVDSALQSERPEFKLRYVQPNNDSSKSRTGIRMLIDEQLTFAQSSYPLLEEEYKQSAQRGFKLKQIPIAIDGIAVAVHPHLNIPGLTLDQLRSIYTGKIVNWQEVGGPNLEITLYSPPASAGGTVEFFKEEVLTDQVFSPKVEFVSTTTQALRQLADKPGGIYYDSAAVVVPQCKIKPLPLSQDTGKFVSPYQEPLVPTAQCPNQRNKVNIEVFKTGQYPITRYLYVVVKQNGQIDARAGEAYANFLLTTQGQELIAKAGFVRR